MGIKKETIEPEVKTVETKKTTRTSKKAVKEEIGKKGKVNCNKLNVRSKDDVKSDVVEIIEKDNEVLILSETEGFYEVKTPYNRRGYCVKKFIDVM